MKRIIQVLLLSLIVTGTVFSQTKKEQKAIRAAEDYEQTKVLIESRQYSFQGEWATTYKGRRINLTTNANFLNIKKDSADIYLPYFGALTSPTLAMSGQGGIVFEGLMENYQVKHNDKKQKITVQFDAKGDNDRFQFTLLISREGNTIINVSSNYRSVIKYEGNIKKPVAKE